MTTIILAGLTLVTGFIWIFFRESIQENEWMKNADLKLGGLVIALAVFTAGIGAAEHFSNEETLQVSEVAQNEESNETGLVIELEDEKPVDENVVNETSEETIEKESEMVETETEAIETKTTEQETAKTDESVQQTQQSESTKQETEETAQSEDMNPVVAEESNPSESVQNTSEEQVESDSVANNESEMTPEQPKEETVVTEPVQETVTTTGLIDGVYTGVGQGFKGDMTVEVEVFGGMIVRVEVLSNRDDRKWFNRANNKIPQSIVDAQSAEVDVVSGATYSSNGIIDGAAEAIEKSRGE